MPPVQHLSYAGVTLPLAPSWLEDKWLSVVHDLKISKFFEPWNFDANLDALPTPALPTPPDFRLGVLTWPTGASRPAWFHNIVSTKIKNSIYAATELTYNTPLNLLLYDGRPGKSVTASMYVCGAPRPLNHLGHEFNDLWLLTLTDQRFYWYQQKGNITQPVSWTDLYTQIATILGVAITVDTIPSAYGSPSAKWKIPYGPTPPLLDAVAKQIGQRIVVGLDGTVQARNWLTAKTDADNYVNEINGRVVSGGFIDITEIARYVPSSVTTLFLDQSTTPTPAVPHTVNNTLVSLAIAEYGTAPGVPGKSQVIPGDLIFDGTNAAAINACAAQTATDYYKWQLCDLDCVYPGTEPWEMTGIEDFVEWSLKIVEENPALSDTSTGDDPFAITRIARGAWNDFWGGNYLAGTTPKEDCTGCEWVHDLIDADCLRVYLDGVDTGVVLSTLDGGATWTADGETITICGTQYSVRFIPGNAAPTNPDLLTLAAVGGSGSGSGIPSYTTHAGCCTCTCINFGFSKRQLCPSTTRDARGPCYDLVRIRLCWEPCATTVTIPCCPDPVTMFLCVDASIHTGDYAVLPGEFIYGTVAFDTPGWRQTTPFGNDVHGNPQYWAIVPCTLPCGGGLPTQDYTQFGYTTISIVTGLTQFTPIWAANTAPALFCPTATGFSFVFDSGTSTACTGSPPDITVTSYTGSVCDCTPITGWDGPGYYCVVNTGSPCSGASPLFLTDNDKCDTSITICSGPYSTISDATAACGGSGITTSCCPSNSIPTTLHVTVSGGGPTYTLVYIGFLGGSDVWSDNTSGHFLRLYCNTGSWTLEFNATPPTGESTTFSRTGGTCSPFSQTFTNDTSGRTYTVTP